MRRMAEYPFDKSRISLGFLSGIDQMAIGRAVLPTLSYDITLKQNPIGSDIPQPRGVRLVSAIT